MFWTHSASTGQCKITRSFEASARVSKERGDSIQVYNLKALAPLVIITSGAAQIGRPTTYRCGSPLALALSADADCAAAGVAAVASRRVAEESPRCVLSAVCERAVAAHGHTRHATTHSGSSTSSNDSSRFTAILFARLLACLASRKKQPKEQRKPASQQQLNLFL